MNFMRNFGNNLFGRKGAAPTTRQPDGGTQGSDAQSPSSLHPSIVAELQRLDHYRSGLGKSAIHYVATGEQQDVVARIEALAKATPQYMAPYHKDSTLHLAASDSALAIVSGAVSPGPQIRRLIETRLATEYARPSIGLNLPKERHALSAFFAMINTGVGRSQTNYKTPWETLITLRQLFEHVKHLNGNLVDLFTFIVERSDTQYLSPGSWQTSSDCADLITTYPTAYAEAMLATKPQNRLSAVKLAEHHGGGSIDEIATAFVKMLCKPFGKQDREIATSALARIDGGQLLSLLQRELPNGDVDTRFGLVEAAGRNGSPDLLALLAERGGVEKAAKVKAAIEAFLETDAASADAIEQTSGKPGFVAVDGSFAELPPVINLGTAEIQPPTDAECISFMAIVDSIQVEWAEKLAKKEPAPTERDKYLQTITKTEIEAAFELLTEGKRFPSDVRPIVAHEMLRRDDGRAWYNAILDRLLTNAAIGAWQGSRFAAFDALIGIKQYLDKPTQLAFERAEMWIGDGRIELRNFATAVHLRNVLHQQRSWYDRGSPLAAIEALPNDAVWPWLAENLPVFDEALGLSPATTPLPLENTLLALALFPKLPQRYFARLLEIAVAEKRPLRRLAMGLLRDAKDLNPRIEALLDDSRQQVRVNAATWLADIRSTQSEKALRKRLKKEKSDPVRAALIEALQRLGFDLSDVIGPASLIAEAEAAAAKTAPVVPDWLAGSGLPTVRFRDGKTVPDLVLRHWIALAIKLKDPGGSGQFGIYLDQLDPADAQTLSNWVLESWIGYDTKVSSLEDATAYALANYTGDWRWQYHQQTPELRDKIVHEMTRRKAGELLNSGSDSKGLLALACRADPVWAANRVRWFLKKHGRRSNQAMALLEALAGTGAPAALQVVIAASARLKQKSTQARAAEIAQRYAEDRGWSFDELADRTVPTAGFDDEGELDLPCGEDEKLYTARLDASLAIHLFNPDGKTIKALPAGDDEATKESKKAFSAAKKELAQVIELQATRLFEAMCVERAWPVADWRLAFHEHPVMRRLIERLVWQGLDGDDKPLELFRPTQEGDFTDASDRPIDIDHFAKVRLAHGTLVDETICNAWIAHLKDYEVTPFLVQFDMLRAPISAELAEEEAILDRQGWTADSLTFRGVAEKRGYERVMRDGGGCNEYVKKFATHGITATIFHTGSHAEDENNRVALKELRFGKQGHRGAFRLKDVPPVMLAECRADYHAVAAKGAFEPEWEKVAPW